MLVRGIPDRRLKACAPGVDTSTVRLERLVIDSGNHTFTVGFHRELTVIGGLDSSARAALSGEIIDSLAGARPGVHLELEAGGRSLTVFRPAGSKHRVVDTDSVADVTDGHLAADGSIDLFAAAGVDRALARRTMLLTSDDLVTQGSTDEVVSGLASLDQTRLWESADRLRHTQQVLAQVSEDSGTSAADIALVDEVEARHAALVAATETYDRIRLISLTIADVGAIAGLTLLLSDGTSGLPFLALAVAGIALALVYRRRVGQATQAEREVLTATGADDYSAFHLERVSALLDGDQDRRRFMQAVSDHHQAAEEWRAVVGDVPVETALTNRTEIQASAGLRSGVGALQFLSEDAPVIADDVTTELAQALFSRIEGVRALTAGDDAIPLIVDDPFVDVEPTMKPMLLELLAETAGTPQMIVLTGDDDVVSWAQLEEMTGRLAICTPVVQRTIVPA